ncbi:MAG: hypothetical protein JKY94_05955 [Rhodobacteraceae bacterium]|nr:hypothetical protein [Paracoccaceae bacterium]
MSLRSTAVRDILQPQNCGYTLVYFVQDGIRYEHIAAPDRVLVTGEDVTTIQAEISDAQTKIIRLNII